MEVMDQLRNKIDELALRIDRPEVKLPLTELVPYVRGVYQQLEYADHWEYEVDKLKDIAKRGTRQEEHLEALNTYCRKLLVSLSGTDRTLSANFFELDHVSKTDADQEGRNLNTLLNNATATILDVCQKRRDFESRNRVFVNERMAEVNGVKASYDTVVQERIRAMDEAFQRERASMAEKWKAKESALPTA